METREDLQRLARRLAEPLVPHFSSGRAHVKLGEARGHYGDPGGLLEGFARPLWGLVPLAAGGGEFDHWPLWQAGLDAGTNPEHPEYWGLAPDYDQRSVEQAAFGVGLALAPDRLWEPLSREVRDRLSRWLRHIDTIKLVDNNWLFFRVLVHLGLQKVGEPWSADQVAKDLDRIESFAREGGWYSDGPERIGDYYAPMAFHFYGLIYAKLANDPERSARFVRRAEEFAQDFQHFFAADGAAVPFGRSLTYRFAQGAFWGALAFADIEALPWPVIRGLYFRHLRWWLRQPIFSESGLLTIGYAYPNALMAESYNSSQSPYWAMKTLLPLALPESHPFWKAEEAPLPPRRSVHTIPGAGLILTTDPESRDVVAINPGQPVLDWPRNAPHKYSKPAYSTRFGFAVPSSTPTPEEGGFDSDLALSDDGRYYRRRDFCEEPSVSDGVAYSRWRPWLDVTVETWLIAEPQGHVRIHRIQSERELLSLEGGFALPTHRPFGPIEPGVVRGERGSVALRELFGDREPGRISLGAGSSLMTSMSAMPVLRGEVRKGETWLACWAGGSSDPEATFAESEAFAFAGGALTRHGEAWWSVDGGSSDARVKWIAS